MPATFLKSYLKELSALFEQVNAGEFEEFIRELAEIYNKGAQVFICGNGGSASSASHLAADLNKGVSFGREKRFKMICLNDSIPTMMAYANDVSYADVFVEQLKNFMNKGDMVIGVSGSGNSENVLRAIRYGNDHGGRTFGVCGFGGGKLKGLAQRSLVIHNNDMQKVEDLHMILFHSAMQYFSKQNPGNK